MIHDKLKMKQCTWRAHQSLIAVFPSLLPLWVMNKFDCVVVG